MNNDGERGEADTNETDIGADLSTEDVDRVEDVAEREPIPDDELITLWGLDSPIELAQILKGDLDDYLTRNEIGNVCTTDLGRRFVGREPVAGEAETDDDEVDNVESGSNHASGVEGDDTRPSTPKSREDETYREDEDGTTARKSSVSAYLERSPDDVVELVQSTFGVNQTTAQRLLDLYQVDDPVDVDELTEGWEFDEAPDVYKYVNNSMSGLARVVGMGDVKLSPDTRERIDELETDDTDTFRDVAETIGRADVGGDRESLNERHHPGEDEKEQSLYGASPPDYYSDRLLETDREKLTKELQGASDHALYPPTEETVISESRYTFGSYVYTFGSFEDALRTAGFKVDGQSLSDDPDQMFRPSEVVAAVQIIADLLGDPPTEALFHDVVSMSSSDTESLGTWRQIIVESGLEKDRLSRTKVPDDGSVHDELVDAIIELVAETERPLALGEVADYFDVPVANLVSGVDSWQKVGKHLVGVSVSGEVSVSPLDPPSAATRRFLEKVAEINPTVHPTIGVLAVLPGADVGSVLDSTREGSLPKLDAIEGDSCSDTVGGGEDVGESNNDEQTEDFDESERVHGERKGSNYGETVVVDDRVRPEYEIERRMELSDDLRRLEREFGHPPRPVDVENYSRFSPSDYVDTFGTWDEVLASVDFEFGDAWSQPEDYDDVLLTTLEKLADEIGHRPTTRNVDELTGYSAATYVSRFGSMDAALRMSDLDVDSPEWAIEIVDEVSESWEPLGSFEDVIDRERAGIEALLLLKRGWRGTGHEIVNEVADRLAMDGVSYRNPWKKTIRPVLHEARERNLIRQNEGTWIWEWCEPDE